MMQDNVQNECELHPDRSDCPDCLIRLDDDSRFGLYIHDGGSSAIDIKFCPWCGSQVADPEFLR